MSNFYKGDRVVYLGKKATVNHVYYLDYSKRMCQITYDNPNGMPLYDNVLSEDLVALDIEKVTKIKKKYWVNSNIACPICETPWTVTKFGFQIWYDCVLCNKTKEAIDKEG